LNKLDDFNEHQLCKKSTVDYIIAPAPQVTDSDTKVLNKGRVIYCIDISGSMSVTTEMPGLQGIMLLYSSILTLLYQEIIFVEFTFLQVKSIL
jgi:hypothetical protein